LAVPVTFALTVAGPWAPIVASFTARPDASRVETPRTIAVSRGAVPATPAVAVPDIPILSWSTFA
jgi:hypothetical protein